jgi:hypothetical protein
VIDAYGDVDGDGTTRGVDVAAGFGFDCVVLHPVAAIDTAAIAAASGAIKRSWFMVFSLREYGNADPNLSGFRIPKSQTLRLMTIR